VAEIGATLREARMRSRIDISEVEERTKIRAKYLRALENEEWDQLPGPAYVKTFLRSYAEALGLDGRRLVEEYKLRHERLSQVELQPISPRSRQLRERPPRRGIPRSLVVAVIFLGLIGALYALGREAEDDPTTAGAPGSPAGSTQREPAAGGDEEREAEPPRRRSSSRRSANTLTIAATGPVSVCLVNAGGDVVVDGAILQAGQTRSFRSRRFRMLLGNNALRLRVNGRLRTVRASDEAIPLEVTPGGRVRALAADRTPVCG
jgi:cytoskeletal protein RodZ